MDLKEVTFCVGMLSGFFVSMLSGGIQEVIAASGTPNFMPRILGNPWLTTAMGAILGALAGGVIGWMIDYTLNRMGAGPALPTQETLVTVRTDEGMLQQVEAALFHARARRLHVSEGVF